MLTYDANKEPDSAEWLAAPEEDRIEAIRRYHRKLEEPRGRTATWRIHACFHLIVENGIALDDDRVIRGVVDGLMSYGLTRHEAVHDAATDLVEQLELLECGDRLSRSAVYQERTTLLLSRINRGPEPEIATVRRRSYAKRRRRSR